MTNGAKLPSFRWSVSPKDVAVSISLASLLLVREWGVADLLHSARGRYFLTGPVGPVLERDALICTAVFAGLLLFLIGLWTTGRSKSGRDPHLRAAAALGLLILLHTLVALTRQIASSLEITNFLASPAPYAVILLLAVVLLGLLILSVARWAKRTWAFVQAAALILLPFSVVRIGQTTWRLIAAPGPKPEAKLISATDRVGAPRPLVLWLLFDEMDQSAVFGNLFGRTKLPNLNRLRETSAYVEHACETGDETLTSIPSYTLGRPVKSVRWDSPDDLMLRFADSAAYVSWSSQRTIFHEANELARHTAILGYFHPYCRLFGHLLEGCQVAPYPAPFSWIEWWATLQPEPLHKAVLLQMDHALSAFPVLWTGGGKFLRPWQVATQTRLEEQHLAAASLLRESLLESLANPRYDFVFAHRPLPHPPGVPHLIGHKNRPVQEPGYAGNLEAADYLLGEIWDLLRSSGRWDETAVILTSDHGVRDFWRSSLMSSPSLLKVMDARTERTVPFLVKLPYQTESIAIQEPVDAVQVHGVLQRLLRGELKHPEELAAYIRQRAADKPCAVRDPGGG